MIKIEDIKEKFEKAIIAVASVDKTNKPHNIAIMYAKVIDNKIIITNNFMKKTIENIKKNPNISLVFWENEEGWRVDGKAEYHESGNWLEFVKKLKENEGLPARGAIVVNIEKINKLCS